eukprot:scaffold584_cov132-Cylindrotheca_fusiformis.AAC.30
MSPFYSVQKERDERKLERHAANQGIGMHLDAHNDRRLGVGVRYTTPSDYSSSKSGKPKPKLSSKKASGKGKGDSSSLKGGKGKGKGSSSGSSRTGKGKGSSTTKGSKKGSKRGSYSSSSSSKKDEEEEPVKFNFVLESTDVQSLDDNADFGLTTTLVLQGDIFNYVNVEKASPKGTKNLGEFRGVCTITGVALYLCTYELYFRTDGEVEAGGLSIRGPVSGSTSAAVVTGTSFDFSIYDTGSVSLSQDPNNRWLIAKTELYLRH